MLDEEIMPDTLEKLVIALCADYERRREVIIDKNATYNVIMEYRFLNYRMLNAAIEIAGHLDAAYFISDIGNKRGYSSSEISSMSESVYKQRKKEVKRNIAKRLSLI